MEDFKEFMQRLIVGANSVYFRDVIEAASGYRITKIDKSLLLNLKQLKMAFQTDLKNISSIVETMYNGRANELSNYMERVVIDKINRMENFTASKPMVSGNHHQSAGYPDLVVNIRGRCFYLEVKTFQLKTTESSLRTFYYKPSKNSKISQACPHLLIAFEVESLGQENKSPFMVNEVKIVDLYDLKVSLKPEFNASNIEIYGCTQI